MRIRRRGAEGRGGAFSERAAAAAGPGPARKLILSRVLPALRGAQAAEIEGPGGPSKD